jgi:hypothetical protein
VLLSLIKRMRKRRRRKLVRLMLSCGVDVRIVRLWVLSSFFFLSFFVSSPFFLILLLHFPFFAPSSLTPELVPHRTPSVPRRTFPEGANDRAPTPKKKGQQQEQCPTPSSPHSRRTPGRVIKVFSRLSERSSRVSPLLFLREVADE